MNAHYTKDGVKIQGGRGYWEIGWNADARRYSPTLTKKKYGLNVDRCWADYFLCLDACKQLNKNEKLYELR